MLICPLNVTKQSQEIWTRETTGEVVPFLMVDLLIGQDLVRWLRRIVTNCRPAHFYRDSNQLTDFQLIFFSIERHTSKMKILKACQQHSWRQVGGPVRPFLSDVSLTMAIARHTFSAARLITSPPQDARMAGGGAIVTFGLIKAAN